MFKTAATKIAHNSTLPALGGNQDLRPLQDLITAEKSVLIALQKLSVDYSKASEALRTWGLNEGDDLGDILSASTTILNHFSSALSQYATHGHTMREQLKAIRTREEALEDLKRRRRNVVRKAEDADKKLSKMSPEHKNLATQTETLNRLRDEIRTLDSDIMTEEAAMADFKRTSARMWMGLKFGGLSEMCEKGAIVAEFGKMIIGEISEEITQPGLPRSLYYGHSKTENYVAEAHRCINEVTLSTVTSVGFRDRRQYEQKPQEIPYPQPVNDDYNVNSGQWTPTDATKPQPPPPLRSSEDFPYERTYQNVDPVSPVKEAYSTASELPNLPTEQHAVDDFGVNSRTPGLIDTANASSGRFVTFPVKRTLGSGSGFSLPGVSSMGSRHEQDQSFSASVAAALDVTSEKTMQATERSQNRHSWVARNRSGPGQAPTYSKDYSSSPAVDNYSIPPNQPHEIWAGRDQPYGAPHIAVSSSPQTAPRSISNSAPLPPPPPGAAPPDLSDPWANSSRGESLQPSGHTRNVSEVSGNGALLAYMTTPRSEPPSPVETKHGTDAHLSAQTYEDEQQRISRHVRFGEIQDLEQEAIARPSLEQDRQDGRDEDSKQVTATEPVQIPQADNSALLTLEPAGGLEKKSFSPTSSTSSNDGSKPKSRRVPPPIFEPEPHQDEQALNAAAAREVTRELEALKNGLPKSPGATQQSPMPTEATSGNGPLPVPLQVNNDQTSDNSILPAPSVPFANRNVSPYPYADMNVGSTQSTPYLGGYTAAQSYAQAYQGSFGSAPSSPAQAYAQSYQAASQAPEQHTTSAIPPRFQALNQETQVPPRFQGKSHSPGSLNASQLPPRFQSGGAASLPPLIALPDQQLSQESRFAQIKGQGSDTPPYRTPPEYPRGLGNGSPYTRSSSSLVTSSAVSGGPRTISAAAFRRPRNTSVDNLGVQSDPFKKTLPSSPYPASRERDLTGGAAASPSLAERPVGAGVGAGTGANLSSLPPGAGPPGNAAGRQSILDDDEFDYIGAYVNSVPNSPNAAEFEQNEQNELAGTMAGVGAGGRPTGAGYGEGRYAS